MSISKLAEQAYKRHLPKRGKSRFNFYPLLGIVLVILLAVLTYGGLFLCLS